MTSKEKAEVLVTGGAGFIGSNLAHELVRRGYKVTVLDDMFLGRAYNLADIKGKIKFVRGSIADARLVEKLARGKKFVFNIAARSSAPMYEPDPRRATYESFNGFLNVLVAAKKAGAKKVVYASSSSVYANLPPPGREDAAIDFSMLTGYSAAKMACEIFAAYFQAVYDVKTVGLRFFSVYGPRERHKKNFANVVSQFLWQMRKNQRPVIYGDGSQARDYIYVDDVVRAIILAAEKPATGIFNVGTGRATSYNEVVALLNKILGKNIKPKYVPNPIKNYVQTTLADTSKAEKELGFKAEFTLEQGLRDLITKGY